MPYGDAGEIHGHMLAAHFLERVLDGRLLSFVDRYLVLKGLDAFFEHAVVASSVSPLLGIFIPRDIDVAFGIKRRLALFSTASKELTPLGEDHLDHGFVASNFELQQFIVAEEDQVAFRRIRDQDLMLNLDTVELEGFRGFAVDLYIHEDALRRTLDLHRKVGRRQAVEGSTKDRVRVPFGTSGFDDVAHILRNAFPHCILKKHAALNVGIPGEVRPFHEACLFRPETPGRLIG